MKIVGLYISKLASISLLICHCNKSDHMSTDIHVYVYLYIVDYCVLSMLNEYHLPVLMKKETLQQ